MILDLFLNDNFKILKCLIENEVTIQEKQLVRLSQGEIATELKMSKAKVNIAIKEFIANGYIEMIGHGKYVICNKGKQIYNYLNKCSNNYNLRSK